MNRFGVNKITVQNTVADIELKKEIAKQHYQGNFSASAVATCLAIILSFTMQGHVADFNNKLWLSIIVSTYIARYFILNHYGQLDSAYYVRKLTIFRLCVTATATTWGLAGILLFPVEVTYQKFLLLTLIGITGGTMVIYAIDRFCAFIFPVIIFAFSAHNFMLSGSPFAAPVLFNAILFLGFVTFASFGVAKRLEENILLRLSEVKSKQKLTQLTQRQQLHIKQTPLAVIEMDSALNITFWNPAATKIFGYTEQEAIGQNIAIILPASEVEAFKFRTIKLIEGGASEQIQTSNIKEDNSTIYCEWFNTVIKNDDGSFNCIAALIQDETAYVTARKEIEQHAYYDMLTQLPNGRLLSKKINQAKLKGTRKKVLSCLLYIDVDNFKFVNDTYGHAAGDQFLVALASELKEILRDTDVVARVGGDEFIILLETTDTDEHLAIEHAANIAKKVLCKIAMPIQFKEASFNTTASIGICLFSEENISTETIIKRADSAMYAAKQAGKNQFQFYDKDIQTKIEYKNILKNDLQLAINKRELELHLQPQVDIQGNLIGAEALLRWKHHEYDFIPPSEFIPLAEETKQIVQIGNWVMLQACRELAAWQQSEQTKHLRLSVNVSAIQFNQANFVETTIKTIQKSLCDPTSLVIELTESSTVENYEDIIPKMNQLRAIGVSFSLDDFGTGQSSLSILKNLPLDELKIDRSFTNSLLKDNESDVFMQTIIALGKRLNLSVIAEGVETADQAAFLLKAGCDNLQGFLFGRPTNIKDFNEQLPGTYPQPANQHQY